MGLVWDSYLPWNSRVCRSARWDRRGAGDDGVMTGVVVRLVLGRVAIIRFHVSQTLERIINELQNSTETC